MRVLPVTRGWRNRKPRRWLVQSPLSGTFRRAADIRGRAYFHIPTPWQIREASHPMQRQNGGLWAMELSFDTEILEWGVTFA